VQLGRLGLSLPSEAQWEYGCRGGTTTVWWTGNEMESLHGAANWMDRYANEHGNDLAAKWLDDGNSNHSRVGSYLPNGFGLHDVTRNVWEWCLETTSSSGKTPRVPPKARATWRRVS